MLPFWHHLQKIDFKWFINDAKKATFTCSGTIELMDQSSGHGKKMEGGLNVEEMSVRYGGSQPKMRNTTINKIGIYPCQLKVGDTQSLTFTYGDAGPFYLSDEEREGLKFDVFSGEKKTKQKTKKMLVDEIKMTGYQIQGHLSKDELERIAALKNVELTNGHCVKKEGWMGKSKGLLQILWERGFIDENNINLYSLKGKKCQMDDDGKLKKTIQKVFATHLDEEVLRFCQRKVGNGAPLSPTLPESRTEDLDARLPQISLQSGRGGHRVCLGDAEA